MARPPKVSHIVQTIIHRVASGFWAVGAALPPSRELAQNLGVTQVTLLHALDELAELGILDLRQRRRTVVSAEGRLRAEEQLLQIGKSSSLERLTLLPCEEYSVISDPAFYWNQVSCALLAEAAHQGLEASVVAFPRQEQVEFVRSLSGRSGNVSVALGMDYGHLAALREASACGLPLILHNRWLPWLNLPTVQRDDYAAARRVGEILRGLGHRNMCMISAYWPNPLWGHERYDGWLKFLAESGLIKQCNPAMIAMPYLTEQQAYIRRILCGPEAPTAVVITNDAGRILLDSVCGGTLDIPRQMSVVNWDEVVQVGRPGAEVPCTRVHVDHRRMAQCIIEMARKIQAGDRCPPSVRVRCDIEVTDSIGPPRPPCGTP